MGIAIAYDNCMCAAAVITREKHAVCQKEGRQEHAEEGSFIWNETVANLILMTLGTGVPGILLAILETITNIDEPASNHGTFTVIGSAVFKLLMITAVCIISIPRPEVKRVQHLGVFVLMAICHKEGRQEHAEEGSFIWNETVANLILMTGHQCARLL